MGKSKHSPAPWTLDIDSGGDWAIRDASGKRFMGNETYYPWQSDNIADVHLIAAAPEMLEALRSVVDALGGWVHSSPALRALDDARAAIAKAEDRSDA